jgi:hypothetical protein
MHLRQSIINGFIESLTYIRYLYMEKLMTATIVGSETTRRAVTPHCYTSISRLSKYDTGHALRISCHGRHRLVFAAGGTIDCKAQKLTLADARRRRHEAQQREWQEFERAEREITRFALTLSDQANPPCRCVKNLCRFDWAEARRAVAETKFWDACCTCAEAALTNCVKHMKQPADGGHKRW